MNETVIHVNGRSLTHRGEDRTTLADFVRGQQLTGTHLGCEHGVCGACTVLVDGKPTRSCITYAVQFPQCEVRTIEGFDHDDVMASLRAAFSEFHGLQCGFCTPGMLITARDIVTRLGNVDEARIREELAGNLCRCTGYNGIVRAIQKAASSYAAPAHAVPPQAAGVALREIPIAIAAKAPTTRKPEEVPLAVRTGDVPGGTKIATHVTVPHRLEAVWALLGDLSAVVRCLPGAELVEEDGKQFKANIRVGLGPITASIAGSGIYERVDSQRTGQITGSGKDKISRSEVKGVVVYTLSPQGDRTRIDVQLGYQLKGMLAQFARGSLVEELAVNLLEQFAANLSSVLEHGQEAQLGSGSTLHIGGSFFQVLVARFKRLFRRAEPG